MYDQPFTRPNAFERISNMSETVAERIAAFLKYTADEEGAISGYVRGGRAYALTREDLAALLAGNAELRARAEKAENALIGATEANAMLRDGITKVRAESAELREEIEDLVRRGNTAFGERDQARAEIAALRGQIASELDDIVEELKQRADGSDDLTGRTILLVQADAVNAAAGLVRGQS